MANVIKRIRMLMGEVRKMIERVRIACKIGGGMIMMVAVRKG